MRFVSLLLPLITLLAASSLPAGEKAGAFTIVVVPDTQMYLVRNPPMMAEQLKWIRENRSNLNAKFVIHVGDIVQNPGKKEEWQLASQAFKTLDGVLPYSFSIGNHDMDVATRDKTLYRQFFPLQRFRSSPAYRGSSSEKHSDQLYHEFRVGDLKFLILCLDYQPDEFSLTWANTVVAAHPSHRVIVNTHAYLNANERMPDGERIWNKFVRKHKNIFMVVCGHLRVGRRVARGDHGNTVHELMGNYQGHPNGGNGWLRLMRFHPSQNRIEVSTYSTSLNRYMAEEDTLWSRLSDNRFDLAYLMSVPKEKEPLPLRKAPSD